MDTNKRLSRYLLLLICLLLVPALACNTLLGDGEEGAVASGVIDSAQSAVDDLDDEGAGSSTGQEEPSGAIGEVPSDGSEDQESSTSDIEPEAQQSQDGTVDDASDAGGEALTEDGSGADVGDAKESILSALRSGQEVDAMRLYVVTEDITSGLVTEVTLAFVRPDRYQMISEGVEIVIIEDTTYMSTGDGEWLTIEGTEMSNTVDSTLEAFAGTEIIDERQQSLSESNVNFDGRETINGVETLVFSYEEGFEGSAFSGSVVMWIGEEDGLLYRQVVENSISGSETRVTMDFEYGESVSIEPPQ